MGSRLARPANRTLTPPQLALPNVPLVHPGLPPVARVLPLAWLSVPPANLRRTDSARVPHVLRVRTRLHLEAPPVPPVRQALPLLVLARERPLIARLSAPLVNMDPMQGLNHALSVPSEPSPANNRNPPALHAPREPLLHPRAQLHQHNAIFVPPGTTATGRLVRPVLLEHMPLNLANLLAKRAQRDSPLQALDRFSAPRCATPGLSPQLDCSLVPPALRDPMLRLLERLPALLVSQARLHPQLDPPSPLSALSAPPVTPERIVQYVLLDHMRPKELQVALHAPQARALLPPAPCQLNPVSPSVTRDHLALMGLRHAPSALAIPSPQQLSPLLALPAQMGSRRMLALQSAEREQCVLQVHTTLTLEKTHVTFARSTPSRQSLGLRAAPHAQTLPSPPRPDPLGVAKLACLPQPLALSGQRGHRVPFSGLHSAPSPALSLSPSSTLRQMKRSKLSLRQRPAVKPPSNFPPILRQGNTKSKSFLMQSH